MTERMYPPGRIVLGRLRVSEHDAGCADGAGDDARFDDAVANPEATTLAQSNPTAFRTKVDKCVRESQKSVYDTEEDDDSTLRFSEEKLSHRVLRDLLKGTVKEPAQVSKNLILSMIDKASRV